MFTVMRSDNIATDEEVSLEARGREVVDSLCDQLADPQSNLRQGQVRFEYC